MLFRDTGNRLINRRIEEFEEFCESIGGQITREDIFSSEAEIVCKLYDPIEFVVDAERGDITVKGKIPVLGLYHNNAHEIDVEFRLWGRNQEVSCENGVDSVKVLTSFDEQKTTLELFADTLVLHISDEGEQLTFKNEWEEKVY